MPDTFYLPGMEPTRHPKTPDEAIRDYAARNPPTALIEKLQAQARADADAQPWRIMRVS